MRPASLTFVCTALQRPRRTATSVVIALQRYHFSLNV